MLSAAAFAINFAEVNSVPATAPADFQAGVLFGFSGKDLRTQVNACFAPDQKIADDTDAFIAAIEAKDIGSIKSIVEGDEKLAIADAATCMTDPSTPKLPRPTTTRSTSSPGPSPTPTGNCTPSRASDPTLPTSRATLRLPSLPGTPATTTALAPRLVRSTTGSSPTGSRTRPPSSSEPP